MNDIPKFVVKPRKIERKMWEKRVAGEKAKLYLLLLDKIQDGVVDEWHFGQIFHS